jgi:diguanylate cyclase (GGDEF)-like protein/PAS domain S-box-containing protein
MKKNEYTSIPEWSLRFDALPDAWLTVSRDGVVRQFNPRAAQLLGLAPNALAGSKLTVWLKRVHRLNLGCGQGKLFALQSASRTGVTVSLEEIPCPLAGWSGRLLRMLNVSEELESQTLRSRKLDRLTALADIMALTELDRQRGLEQTLELGARALGLELGLISHIEGNRYTLLAHNAPGVLEVGLTYSLPDTYCSLTVAANDVVALSSFQDSVYADHPCYQQFGFKSYIGAPLRVHGELFGTLCFCSRTVLQGGFDHNDSLFVKLLARWVGGVIERMNVESSLRVSHGELVEQLELLAMAEKVARLGHWRLDVQGRSMLLSDEVLAILGLPHQREWGLGEFEALIAVEDREAWREQLHLCADEGTPLELELRMSNVAGYTRWLSLRGMRLDLPHQQQLFGVFLDITDSKQAQETILFQASHDALTGLINRVLLFDRLGQEIRRCQRSERCLAVLFIDLDHFKAINDQHGHEAGDRVLIQVARRLSQALRNSDTVGRFGGDEFIAIIPGVEQRDQLIPLLKKILRKLEAPILFGKQQLFISASIGAALYPTDAILPQELIRKADHDMYLVKEQRRHLSAPGPAATPQGSDAQGIA